MIDFSLISAKLSGRYGLGVLWERDRRDGSLVIRVLLVWWNFVVLRSPN